VNSGIPREDAHAKNDPLSGESESARVPSSSIFQARVNHRRMFLVNTGTEAVAAAPASKEVLPFCEPVPSRTEAKAPTSSPLPPVQDMAAELLAAVAASSLSTPAPIDTDRPTGDETRHDEPAKSQLIGEARSAARDPRSPAATRSAKRGIASPRPRDGGRSKTDRRESYRYDTPGVQLFVTWPDNAGILVQGPAPAHPERQGRNVTPVLGRMVRYQALLLNFSQTGLRILISHLPPEDRQLWVGIDESKNGIWTPVLLRSFDPAEAGRYAVRLSFVDACPYDLFKHAVLRPMGEREAVAFRSGQDQG
jgi:hypothetical protein